MLNGHISVWGRTLAEYEQMFNLYNMPVSWRVLSVADGPSTLNNELRERGITIISVDPIYAEDVDTLKALFAESYTFNKRLFYDNPTRFNYQSNDDIEALLAKRQRTFELFLTNFQQNRSHYVVGELPELPLASASYDLCLCANLLFMFDHVLDFSFHRQAIDEMVRVSREVRIFPLYGLDGQESRWLNGVISHLDERPLVWSIEPNTYGVWKNGNRYLRITHP